METEPFLHLSGTHVLRYMTVMRLQILLAGVHLGKSPRGGQKHVRRHFGGGCMHAVSSIQF